VAVRTVGPRQGGLLSRWCGNTGRASRDIEHLGSAHTDAHPDRQFVLPGRGHIAVVTAEEPQPDDLRQALARSTPGMRTSLAQVGPIAPVCRSQDPGRRLHRPTGQCSTVSSLIGSPSDCRWRECLRVPRSLRPPSNRFDTRSHCEQRSCAATCPPARQLGYRSAG
jgi:hypothetical protein